jgi:hypothetical protein
MSSELFDERGALTGDSSDADESSSDESVS